MIAAKVLEMQKGNVRAAAEAKKSPHLLRCGLYQKHSRLFASCFFFALVVHFLLQICQYA